MVTAVTKIIDVCVDFAKREGASCVAKTSIGYVAGSAFAAAINGIVHVWVWIF
jgi:hypothetical protein